MAAAYVATVESCWPQSRWAPWRKDEHRLVWATQWACSSSRSERPSPAAQASPEQCGTRSLTGHVRNRPIQCYTSLGLASWAFRTQGEVESAAMVSCASHRPRSPPLTLSDLVGTWSLRHHPGPSGSRIQIRHSGPARRHHPRSWTPSSLIQRWRSSTSPRSGGSAGSLPGASPHFLR